MGIEIIRVENRLCSCCMEKHEVKTIRLTEQFSFKGVNVEHLAEYYYCDHADEYYADEEQMSANDLRMKDAYRSIVGLLTSQEICQLRAKYGISQSDLCALLGWGGKTIARYENHQVQDKAHDTILRKLSSDPEWFLELLNKARGSLTEDSFRKYYEAGKTNYEETQDLYLRKAIEGRYISLSNNPINNGNTALSLDKVVEVIAFFANSQLVTTLYKVKLMKLLWYADALSYKRRGHAVTGLIYVKKPMGALPLAHDLIIDLKGVTYEEIDFGEGSGYHFTRNNTPYSHLTSDEQNTLETVVEKFGKMSKDKLVDYMHKELAYTETAFNDIIQFKYALDLSIE